MSSSKDEHHSNIKICSYTSQNTIVGYHPKSGVLDSSSISRKKVKIGAVIRLNLFQANLMETLKKAWMENMEIKLDNVEIIQNPFKICIVDNFIENTEVVDKVLEDFNELNWIKKNLDLYEFFQSKDLKNLELNFIEEFHRLLKTDLLNWVADLSQCDLVEVSATCSCFTNTDYLLVHDDRRGDRIIAFVFYLNDAFDIGSGGFLDLLESDKEGYPSTIMKSVSPKRNRLIFFPVTKGSYHQVAEITNREGCRLSINGWFHAKNDSIYETIKFKYSDDGLFGTNKIFPQCDVNLRSWIDEEYLDNTTAETLDQIREHIEETSELALPNFFKLASYENVKYHLEALEKTGGGWMKHAPPDRSCYDILIVDSLNETLQEFVSLFKSQSFFAYLRRITNLDLKSMKLEFQRWTQGSYCLLTSDVDWNNSHELDLIMYFPLGDGRGIIGGRIEYVNIDEEIQEALITIEPSENTMNIVYRDTARFTNYFSKQSSCEKFYVLICCYSE